MKLIIFIIIVSLIIGGGAGYFLGYNSGMREGASKYGVGQEALRYMKDRAGWGYYFR